jgi:hypothetical protein
LPSPLPSREREAKQLADCGEIDEVVWGYASPIRGEVGRIPEERYFFLLAFFRPPDRFFLPPLFFFGTFAPS